MIPMSAVERIEVLTDGASAIYGSDAVGGVVNIILRKSFDGAETSARYGSVSNGGSHETQLAQTFGQSWNGGSGLISYEFYDRTPLSASARSYTQDAYLPFTLLPEQVRQGVFGSVNQSVGPDISLFADGIFSHRITSLDSSGLGVASVHTPSQVTLYSGTVGGRVALSPTTEAEISGGYSSTDFWNQYYELPSSTPSDSLKAESSVLTLDGTVRGSFWSLPAGPIRYAVGGQFRRESYDFTDYFAPPPFSVDRRIVAGFAELRVPILSASDTSLGGNRLELSVADRDEHYSDFGSTNNPKVGLILRALPGFKLRGTYGTSFVAPQLQDLNPVPNSVYAFNTSIIPGGAPPGGDVNALLVQGGNPNLTAQKAKTWTFGADFEPVDGTGPRASVTYYGTKFDNRISSLYGAGIYPYTVLANAATLGPQFAQFNPPAALVQSLINTPGFVNFGANLADITALINGEYLNISHVSTSGIDFDGSYQKRIRAVDLNVALSGTYVLMYDEQLSSTSPVRSILNTTYNPLRFKARGQLGLAYRGFSTTAFINYANAYRNNQITPEAPISSWTTVDLTGHTIARHATASWGISQRLWNSQSCEQRPAVRK